MAAAAACGVLASRQAGAVGTLTSGGGSPVEQRVALSIGPDRTTLWTSVRVDAAAGPVAIIAPAAPGASLDWSSAAWFEALEDATAPRIVAPALDCRGRRPAAKVDVAGELGHEVPLAAGGVAVLADAAAVAAWAQENGLSLSPELQGALEGLAGQRFVAARFDAPAGTALTPTLRIVSPAPVAELPLVLTRAGDEDLLITTWVLGRGRARLDGALLAAINPADLTFNAGTGSSTYSAARARALGGAGYGAALVEAAGHGALAGLTPIWETGEVIPGVADAYFDRAAGYGDGLAGAPCIDQATAALAGAAPVAASCPRAALGVVDGSAACAETVDAGQTDPEALRCGPGADDLAVALSGQAPNDAWITRQSMILRAGSAGARGTVSLPGGPEVSPIVGASALACDVPVRRVPSSGCSCSGTEDTITIGVIEIIITGDEEEPPPDSYYQEEDCEGDPAETYESDSYEGETSEDDSGCSGDSSDTGDTSDTGDGGSGGDETSDSGDSGDDGCGSDTTETTESTETTETTESDSGGSDCSVSSPRRRVTRLRLSPLALGALMLLAPLRRALRPRRRPREPGARGAR